MKLKQLFLAAVFSMASVYAFAAGAPALTGPVNINTADQAGLESLNGIGPKLAAAILQNRKEKGPFKTVDELSRVPGVGKKVVERNRNYLTIGQ